MKKFFAAVMIFVTVMLFAAPKSFAAEFYTAKLGFADVSWAVQDWDSAAEITGKGQFSVEANVSAPDIGTLVIDIEDLFEKCPAAAVSVNRIEIDGKNKAFDPTKILYGDINDNGDYRIEIYDQLGMTKFDPPIDPMTEVSSKIKVTFTVSGLNAENADKPAESITENNDTAAANAGVYLSEKAIDFAE